MDIKSMLIEYPHISETIQKLNRETNDILKNKLETRDNLKAVTLTDMPRGSEVGNPTLEAVERIIDVYDKRVQEISNEIEEYMNIKEYIDRVLKELNVDEYRLIDLRYFKLYKFKRIAHIMHYSVGYTYEMHDKAIKKMLDKT